MRFVFAPSLALAVLVASAVTGCAEDPPPPAIYVAAAPAQVEYASGPPPRAHVGAVWVQGHWRRVPRGWAWVPGHWR